MPKLCGFGVGPAPPPRPARAGPGRCRNQLLEAEEVFVTNSAMGVMPVCRIERKAIGRDKPGEVTADLMSRYAALTEAA